MKCIGYFSREQIFDKIEPDWWLFLLLGLILTLIFTVIINSYWPILFSIYKHIKLILNKERSASREMILMVSNTENNKKIDDRDQILLIKLMQIWKNYKIKIYGLGKINS
jgi:hypothetical protein